MALAALIVISIIVGISSAVLSGMVLYQLKTFKQVNRNLLNGFSYSLHLLDHIFDLSITTRNEEFRTKMRNLEQELLTVDFLYGRHRISLLTDEDYWALKSEYFWLVKKLGEMPNKCLHESQRILIKDGATFNKYAAMSKERLLADSIFYKYKREDRPVVDAWEEMKKQTGVNV